MAKVSQCDLLLNGQSLEFISVEEKEIELAKVIKLMKGSDTIDSTPVYQVTIKYPKPKDGVVFDFKAINGGTITVAEDGGERITYSPVKLLKIGAWSTDDDKEKSADIEFWAKKRTVE